MSKFKVGDKVIRVGPSTYYTYYPNVIKGMIYIVYQIAPEAYSIVIGDESNGENYTFNACYFILEDVYNSPLYQALL